MTIFVRRTSNPIVVTSGDSALQARAQASRATQAATQAQAWAESESAPDFGSAKSARSWATEAGLAATSSIAAANFHLTVAQGIAATAVDAMFTTGDISVVLTSGGTNVTGALRSCLRTATAPYYVHLGAAVDPASKAEYLTFAAAAGSAVSQAQSWAEGAAVPGAAGTRSAKAWAVDAGFSAASALAAGNYYATVTQAIAAVAIGGKFSTTDSTVVLAEGGTNSAGFLRTCVRTANAPYYSHVGAVSDPLSRKEFGAFADAERITPNLAGAGNQAAILASACSTSAVAGKRIVEIPEGSFATSQVNIPSGTWLRGRGMEKTTLRPFDLSTQFMLWGASAGDLVISDLTLDGENKAILGQLLFLSNAGSRVRIERVRFRNWPSRAPLVVNVQSKIDGFVLKDCEFINCAAGGLIANCTQAAVGSSNLVFDGNVWDGCGGNLCQLSDYRGTDLATLDQRDCWRDVHYTNNVVRNCVGFDVGAGPIPNEIWGAKNLIQTGNIITSGTRGLSGGANNQDVVIAGNIIANQTIYAIEGGASVNTRIHDNLVINCACLYKDTGFGTGHDAVGATINIKSHVRNLEIKNNTVIGSGLPAFTSVNTIDLGNNGNTLPLAVRVIDNKFHNIENVRSVIYFIGQRPYPLFTASSAGSGAAFAYTYKVTGGQVERKGYKYTNAPTVTLVSRDGNGSGATATCTIDGLGRLAKVTVTAAGSGYTAPPQAIISGGGGYDGELDMFLGIESVTITAGGSGYSNGTCTIANNGAHDSAIGSYTTTGGAITAITLTAAGSGFGRTSTLEVCDNTYEASTYASTIPFFSALRGRIISRNNRWIRRSYVDSAHFSIVNAAPVFGLIGEPAAGGNPSVVSLNDSAEMLGPIMNGTLLAIGQAEATTPRYGCRYSGLRLAGNFSNGPLAMADSSGSTVLEAFDLGSLKLPGGFSALRNNLNASLLVGMVTGESLLPAASYVNIGAATKPGLTWRGHFQGTGTTRTIKLRHERLSGEQTQAIFHIDWMSTSNNATPQANRTTLVYGNTASPTLAPFSFNGSGTTPASIISALDASGRMETTLTLPTGNNEWLATIQAAINNRGTTKSWADFSVQVG
jgi:hypothetical protein